MTGQDPPRCISDAVRLGEGYNSKAIRSNSVAIIKKSVDSLSLV